MFILRYHLVHSYLVWTTANTITCILQSYQWTDASHCDGERWIDTTVSILTDIMREIHHLDTFIQPNYQSGDNDENVWNLVWIATNLVLNASYITFQLLFWKLHIIFNVCTLSDGMKHIILEIIDIEKFIIKDTYVIRRIIYNNRLDFTHWND